MKFNQETWFCKLTEALLLLNKEDNLICFLIHAGPLCFQVVMPHRSHFIKAMNSFYDARIAEKFMGYLPTIYCLDESYIHKLPIFNIKKNDLNLNAFKSRLSNQKKIINYDESRNIFKGFNTEDQNYLFFCKSFESLPSWEFYSPLKEFIHFIALDKHCWLSHAGSLCKDNMAVLLFGPGGNGKSTTTLRGITDGLKTVGDDYILVEDKNSEFFVHSIYRTIKSYPTKIFKLPSSFNNFEQHTIESTGKYVYICPTEKEASVFSGPAKIIVNFGLHLKKKINAGKKDAINFNARYLSLSSIEQIPFWIDKSTKFSEKMFDHIPHVFLSSDQGIETLEKNLVIVNGCFKEQNR
jgi:hypothetical protein